VFRRWQWLNLSCIHYQEFNVQYTLFCRNSSAFDRATVSLECQTGQACTGGLDLNVLQCRSKHSDGPENAPKYAHRNPKMKIFLPRPRPQWGRGERDTPCPMSIPHSHILSATTAPLSLRLRRRSTWHPANPNPGLVRLCFINDGVTALIVIKYY